MSHCFFSFNTLRRIIWFMVAQPSAPTHSHMHTHSKYIFIFLLPIWMILPHLKIQHCSAILNTRLLSTYTAQKQHVLLITIGEFSNGIWALEDTNVIRPLVVYIAARFGMVLLVHMGTNVGWDQLKLAEPEPALSHARPMHGHSSF